MSSLKKSRKGPRSTIQKLPKELIELVNKLVKDGRTITEITEKLNELGADISRSAVGRYSKQAKDYIEKYQEAQKVSKIWIDKFGEEPDGDVGRLLQEMLRILAFQTMNNMSEEQKSKPGEIMSLAIALEKLSRTHQIDLKNYVDRKQIRDQVKEVSEQILSQAKKSGWDKNTVDAILKNVADIGG